MSGASVSDDYAALRERLAAIPTGVIEEDEWGRSARVITGDELADAVLEALGLEQVGWMADPCDHNVPNQFSTRDHLTTCMVTNGVPIYRLGGPK